MRKKSKIIFILGPTGVGKSEFAARLAKKIKGEIISCDSMQVYKGMRALSQYPPAKLLKAVPHRLIGCLSPSEEWSAADFVKAAKKIADDMIRRGKIPVITGGTGLYARAFTEGLFPSPMKDEKFRKKIYNEAKKSGSAKIYDRLKKIDPAYAAKIHPNDTRRIVRALEVYKLTGRPVSAHHPETKGLRGEYDISIFILNRKREALYDRINRRVDEMFDTGIVKEVKRLRHSRLSKTAKTALGYKEVCDYIDGKIDLSAAKDLIKMNTRHYAKRQLTWFRREKGAKWVDMDTKNNKILKS